ncbi:uncharacterized protein LOC128150285 isoform X4 [Harpia harpyja]|uniref:uncharacterized protein LOC128150285 isoform X4 n=1 Tax=Harpia harpyja TaxID=202280 RepID=UPI0022B0F97B|nr:uncharacterized protein LOC128150285 isoform X4 [Harpia harpyja]
MTAAAGCKLSMGSANAEPGPAEPQPGGRSRRPPPAARSGAWGSAERRAQPGAEPGAASGSGSTAADGAGQRLPSRLGKSFPDPNGVKTHTKKIHCISILPKKGRFTLTPSTGSSRQGDKENQVLFKLKCASCSEQELSETKISL